jgi:hypothetical protein
MLQEHKKTILARLALPQHAESGTASLKLNEL